jgi:succinate-semialdehyde dehydrogenase/glutarate-semialdehyde dehydrogenase
VLLSARAQLGWSRRSFAERGRCFVALAERLEHEQEELARLMAEEMGKPLAEGRAEIQKCAWVARFYAEHAAAFLADRTVATDARKSFVTYRPLGLVLAIMPWNFPFWQVLRFAAPALMAGNGALLKHASNVCGCALAIERLSAQAGFPAELFATLLVDSERVPELLDMSEVAAVTLTGSTRAGRSVASAAGARVKKTVLELGGSDPYVVLADADLDAALEACVRSRMINGGQSCIAAKRFVVVRERYGDFVEGLVARMRRVRMGDPRAEGVELGPLARADLRDELHEQVVRSVAAGAELLLGGEVPEGKGFFYPPTVLAGVRPGMPAHDEELFGPVAAVLRAEDEQEALRLAADTSYGLGAAVFTSDLALGERIAREELHAGACFVNAHVRSDPRLPFGGIRSSGHGRELSEEGIREFVNAKTVWVG